MVTLYDVARQAGVSIATVSRVLHGQEPVRESTRDRVRAAIEELGYVPDGAAQSLARSRKDVIGLVCVEHTGLNPNQYDIESMSLLFYDEVMRGVEALIRERHWSLLITYLREDENRGVAPQEDEPVLPRLLALSGKVDGLLIGEGVVPATALARLARRLPVVVVAGDTAHARRRRGGGGQLVGRARAGAPPGRSTTAGAGCSTSTGRRPRPTRRPGGWRCRRSSTRSRAPGWSAPTAVGSACRAARRRPSRCWPTSAAPDRDAARRDRLRERPDGHRRAAHPDGARDPGAGRRRAGRLRRHLSRHLVRPAADHGSPADPRHRRARLRAADRADRQPDAAARGRTAPDRARHPVQLRLPARHGDAQAGGDRRPGGLPMRQQQPAGQTSGGRTSEPRVNQRPD